MDYSYLKGLSVNVIDGVANVKLRFDGHDETVRRFQHRELTEIWRAFEHDPDVKSVLITGGSDDEFYLSGRPPGGIPGMQGNMENMWKFSMHMDREVRALGHEMIHFPKPVVAAVHGSAAGAGLTVVLLSDISVMAQEATLFDPHIMLGISAGDGAGGLLPLFTGIAKAKLYLLTSDALTGREAERIGLISRSVPKEQVSEVAADYARRFAKGPEVALRFTKRGINQWLRLSELVSQDYSLILEALSEYSGERKGNPYMSWPPRQVP